MNNFNAMGGQFWLNDKPQLIKQENFIIFGLLRANGAIAWA